jgi:hypothetical protein
MLLFRENGKVLLAALERRDFLAGRALKVHAEPEHGDEYAGDTHRYVLRNLAALVAAEIGDPDIVGLRLD